MGAEEPRTDEAVRERLDRNPFLKRRAEEAALVVATWPANSQEKPFLILFKHRYGSTGGGDCIVASSDDETAVPARSAELAALARWRRFSATQGMGDVPWSSLPESMREGLIASSRLDLQAALPAFRREWLAELQTEAEERLEGFKMSAEAAAFEAGAAQAQAEDDADLAVTIAAGACVVAVASIAALVRFRR
jgi:hypothetical protein